MSDKKTDSLRIIDPVLTSIAKGYTNSSFIATELFPEVNVNKLKGKVPSFGKDAFILRDTTRAIGGASNRIPSSEILMIEFETTEKDVEMALDYLEQEEAENWLRYESSISKTLNDSIMLVREKTAADLAQDSANYDPTSVNTILVADAFDDYESASDPIAIIKDAMDSVRSKIARFPNTMIIGQQSYRALCGHPKVIERIKYSGISKANTKVLSEILDISDISVGLSVYTADGVNFTDVWADNIVLAYVDKSPKGKRNEFNPSFGYTFQREGKPEVDTYFENGGKIKVIRNTDNYAIKITAPDAGFLIKNTNHN